MQIQNAGSVSISSLNKNNSPNQDTGFVSNGYERRSSLTLYVPMKIDIDEILLRNPPDFEYDRDKFVYILHLISSIPSRKNGILDNNAGYTPVNKSLLQRRIHNYSQYIDYLAEKGVIEVDKQFIPDKKSGGLKFSKEYISVLVPVEITKWTLIKSILYLNQNKNNLLTEGLTFLKRWFEDGKLTVNFEGAKEELNKLAIEEEELGLPNIQERFNSRLVPLLELMSDYTVFGVDNTGYRLHTSITRLKKELRKNIKYNNKTLVSIDIVNSQPFLTLPLFDLEKIQTNDILSKIKSPVYFPNSEMSDKLLKTIEMVKDEEDVKIFIDCVWSGNFYEKFGEVLQKEEILPDESLQGLRKKVKEITFESIYSPNTSIAYSSCVKIFKSTFPNVYKIFELIKTGRGNHPAFSIMLQRLESELILEKACKIINRINPEIPLFTIHDSIATTEEHTTFVENIMTKVFTKYIGKSPKFKLERWD